MRTAITLCLAGPLLLAACGQALDGSSEASSLATLVVDENFDFSTTRSVVLDIDGARLSEGEMVPVEILDHRQASLFKGVAVPGKISRLRLQLPLKNTSVTVKADGATQEVFLADDHGTLRLRGEP